MSIVKVPSALGNQPSYAGVILEPRSLVGSNGKAPWVDVCAVPMKDALVTAATTVSIAPASLFDPIDLTPCLTRDVSARSRVPLSPTSEHWRESQALEDSGWTGSGHSPCRRRLTRVV